MGDPDKISTGLNYLLYQLKDIKNNQTDFTWIYVLIGFLFFLIGIFSIIVGFINAMFQFKIKRFLAYSSIFTIGFLIIILVQGNIDSFFVVFFYLLCYSITLMSFFFYYYMYVYVFLKNFFIYMNYLMF